jgi:hypothetical protein
MQRKMFLIVALVCGLSTSAGFAVQHSSAALAVGPVDGRNPPTAAGELAHCRVGSGTGSQCGA